MNDVARSGRTGRLPELGSSGATISLTRRSRAKILDCTFEENSANFGGAIFLRDLSSITIRDSIFKGNNHSAIYKGGALYAKFFSRINISNCIFEGNIVLIWVEEYL